MTTVTIELPEATAAMARREGLLSEEVIRDLLEEATRVAAMKRLQGMWQAVPTDQQDEPPLSGEALEAIIREVRRHGISPPSPLPGR